MSFFLFLGSLGTPELIIVAVVGLLLFGRRLPEVGRSVGKSFFEFKRGMQGLKDEIYEAERLADEAAAKPPRVETPPDIVARGSSSETTSDEEKGEDKTASDDTIDEQTPPENPEEPRVP